MDSLRYLLDTNALSEVVKQPAGVVARRIAAAGEDRICTSIVVACELRYGAMRKGSPVLNGKIEQLLSGVEILPLDEGVDRRYADLRMRLEQAGQPISAHDMLIAAHALTLGLTMVTANVREFRRVPGLAVENWLEP